MFQYVVWRETKVVLVKVLSWIMFDGHMRIYICVRKWMVCVHKWYIIQEIIDCSGNHRTTFVLALVFIICYNSSPWPRIIGSLATSHEHCVAPHQFITLMACDARVHQTDGQPCMCHAAAATALIAFLMASCPTPRCINQPCRMPERSREEQRRAEKSREEQRRAEKSETDRREISKVWWGAEFLATPPHANRVASPSTAGA